MRKKSERMKVEVTDSIAGEMRTFTITLTAPNVDFQLTDLLRDRGVIAPPDGELGRAVKAAAEHYLSDAEKLISTLTQQSKSPPQPPSNALATGSAVRPS